MATAASATSLVLALVLAARRPRGVSPVGVLLALGVGNLGLAVATHGDLARVLDTFRLHPILALAIGLLLGRLLDKSGGLATLAAGVRTMGRTPIGAPGTLVLVVFLPLALCLPCGHMIAAALAPVLPHLCPEEGRAASGGVLAAAFARTAYGACGPAPAGGIGTICEGWLAQGWPAFSDGILRAPQIAALVFAIPAAAWMARRAGAEAHAMPWIAPVATTRGGLALVVFFAAIVVALVRPFGPLEAAIPLAVASLLLWPLASQGAPVLTARSTRVDLSPVTGVVLAFLAVGCVAAAGGLDALGGWLRAIPGSGRWVALAAIVLAPSAIPLPCGRILGYLLAPILYGLGPARGGPFEWNELIVGMAVLATTLSTSCAHSPFCGGGMVVARRARASRLLRSLAGSLIVAVPCAGFAAIPTMMTTTRWVWVLAGAGAVAGALLAGLVGFAGGKARIQGAFGGLAGGALAGATLWVH